jgi:hypothetical protein
MHSQLFLSCLIAWMATTTCTSFLIPAKNAVAMTSTIAGMTQYLRLHWKHPNPIVDVRFRLKVSCATGHLEEEIIDHELSGEDCTQPSQSQSDIQFIAKTVESFKLADLYWLESCVMAYCKSESTQPVPSDDASGTSWTVKKLAFHRPTASYLLGCYTSCDGQYLHADNADASTDGNSPSIWANVPFRKDRCQYVAQVIATGQSPQELLDNIIAGSTSGINKWTLEYDIFESLQGDMYPKRSFSSTMLMCAVSRILPGEPMLMLTSNTTEVQADKVSFMIIETSSRLYFTKKLLACSAGVSDGSKHELQNLFRSSWARRPFQYSGAINLDVAITIVYILRDLVRSNNNPKTLRMLDPTCGSGTFLALALMMWGVDSNVEVTGIDSNPKCSLGTMHNLQHLFNISVGENAIVESSDVDGWLLALNSNSTRTPSRASIYSGNSVHLQTLIPDKKFDCAVANLPWNRNTFEFQEDLVDNECTNSRILRATAAALLPGSPLVVVSGGSQKGRQSVLFDTRRCLESIGFHVLGEATVPPQGFHLPLSAKKVDASQILESQGQALRSSDCLITVAVARSNLPL